MERIASFCVDHTRLLPGMYLSRQDGADGEILTWDIRMKQPNKGSYLSPAAAHTLEHLFATYARNSKYSRGVVYVGPMGCLTGFYLLTTGLTPAEALDLTRGAFAWMAEYEGEIPGASAVECGNYLMMDPIAARAEAAAILTRVALPEQRKTVVLMKQVQWGVAKLAIPQSAGAGVTENGMYTVTSEQDACGVIATSVTDSAYKGLSVTVLTEQQMNNILTQAFNSTDGKLSNAKSTKVSFGSVKAYRTVGTLTTDEGAGDCLIFTYITGNKMDMICLLAYENDTALKNMANGLMVGGVTASPQF